MYIQALLDSAVLPILLDIMNTAEFKIIGKKQYGLCVMPSLVVLLSKSASVYFLCTLCMYIHTYVYIVQVNVLQAIEKVL